MECDIWKSIRMENHSTPRNKCFQSYTTGWKKAFLVCFVFPHRRTRTIKSVQLLTVDKSVFTDQKILFLLDLQIYLAHQYSALLSKISIQSWYCKICSESDSSEKAYKVPNLILIFVRQGTRWFPAWQSWISASTQCLQFTLQISSPRK